MNVSIQLTNEQIEAIETRAVETGKTFEEVVRECIEKSIEDPEFLKSFGTTNKDS